MLLVLHFTACRRGEESRFTRVAAVLIEGRENSALAGAAIGFCLIDGKGVVVMDEKAKTAFIPASSLKTVTTATALEVLGADFRFITELKATVAMKNGVIDGDVVIVGGGDPMLSEADLQRWAEELRKRGLRRITGRVRGDGGFFRGSIYGDFWNWGDIGNGYGSGVSGLNLGHNRFTAQFDAGKAVGEPARFIGAFPELPGVAWRNEVLTGETGSGDGVVIHGGERATVMHLRGTVPLGAKSFKVTGAVPDPVAFAASRFQNLLKVECDGEDLGRAPAGHLLLKHESPPLLEIITSIHASSDNHETECVFRMLGVKAGKAPAEVIREHWKARGLEFSGLRMEDGCGLARADFIRPLDLARLQFFAGSGPQGAIYKASLLSEGGLKWKGGAMSGVRTYTGFVTGKSGEEFCFAFMVNHFTDASAVAELRQQITEAMLRL